MSLTYTGAGPTFKRVTTKRQRRPKLAQFSESIEIERDADAVWAVVGDIGAISGWLPFLTESRLDGDTRVCQAGEVGELTETILSRNDAGRSYEYTITESPMPIESIKAGIQVDGSGDRSTVTWSTEVEPGALAEQFSPIYREGLETLKQQLESAG